MAARLASGLPFPSAMNHKSEYAHGTPVVCLAVVLGFLVNLQGSARVPGSDRVLQGVVSTADERAIATFEDRVKEYVKLRNRVKGKLPKLSKDSTPEQLRSHMTAFKDAVRAARAGAKRGALFVPEIAGYIRTTLRENFKGNDKFELRKTILEAETQGVPVRINYPYPEAKEFAEMPPTLLLRLPQLPREMRYRFVGTNLLLVDRENNLIIDYMVDALP